MNRRTAIRRLAIFFMTSASLAQAQQAKKVPLLGYLSNTDPVRESARAEVIRLALRELGHVEGQNIAIEYRYAEGKRDRYPELVAELVRLNIDIIVAAGGSATVRAAKNATKTIPIVMVGAGLDPVEAGVVESLARPGGNVTGITLLNSELPVAARALRLTIQPWEVRARSADGFEKVFAALSKERPDGLYVITGTAITAANRKQIVGLALKSRLPSVVTDKAYVELGGLISYGADPTDSYRRVAYYVDRILKGAKPADLPVEQPMKFELVINLQTAKKIGVTIPPELLARASKIIR